MMFPAVGCFDDSRSRLGRVVPCSATVAMLEIYFFFISSSDTVFWRGGLQLVHLRSSSIKYLHTLFKVNDAL